MHLNQSSEWNDFRRDARQWLENNRPEIIRPATTPKGYEDHLDWERKLYQAGWSALNWPSEYGGQGLTLWEWLVFEEEYYRAECPIRITQNGVTLLGPALMAHGTERQKAELLPRMASATDIWAQGWSEPEAGSDLAAVRSRAVWDENRQGWMLSGQKTWTTRGGICNKLFGLFRTDQNSERHRGLSYLLVDLEAEGVTVRPFPRFDGEEEFADVYFDNVFVPHWDILGEVDQGWRVAMATAGSERGLSLRSPARYNQAVSRLLGLYETAGESSASLLDVSVRAQAYKWFTYHSATKTQEKSVDSSYSSVNKIVWSDLDIEIHELGMDVMGESALIDNDWSRNMMFSLGGPIYAGTNEIQKNIIAERVMGLPR